MNTKRINCQYCNGTMPPPNTPPAPQLPASSARLPYGYAGWPREEYYAVAALRSALAQSCIGSSTAAFNAAQNLLGNGMAQFDLPPSDSGMLPPTNSELFRQLDSFMLRTDQSSLFDAAELKLPAPPQHRERANHHGLFTKAEASATFPASEVPDSSLQNQMESHLSATSCAGAPATVSHAGTSKSSAEPPAARPSKTRVRWTQELHERFVECVNQLGGADQATPKKILKLINSDGLTIYHVKSHLQKYRMTNYAPPPSAPSEGKQLEKWGNTESREPITGMHITEALRVQLDLQRRLCEQLEMQRSLQVRIEEQGKMLQKMFEHQLKASGNSAPVPPDSDDDNVLFPGATAEQDDDVLVDIVIDDEMQLMSVANDD